MRRNNTIYSISLIALLTAIMALFSFTPLGAIHIGTFNITLMGIPLAIMAVTLGPIGGLLGGAIWGGFSLIQGLTGMDPSGPVLFEYSPIGLIVACLGARMITGFVAGLLYDVFNRYENMHVFATIFSSLSVPILNTFFFMGFYSLFFFGMNGADNPLGFFLVAMTGILLNFVIELSINAFASTAICLVIDKVLSHLGFVSPFPHFFQRKLEEKAA
ncbi:MAG: ECF transporter S component [Bacilli bacterium]|nr:ECF transporter S component [Bacilli bacterium]